MSFQNPSQINKAAYSIDEADRYANYCAECVLRVFGDDADLTEYEPADQNSDCIECIYFATGVHPSQ